MIQVYAFHFQSTPEVVQCIQRPARFQTLQQAPIVADGDALQLAYPDNTFDIVHAHQLLVHVSDPVAVLREFHRVLKPGGLLAVRDSSPATVLSLKPDLPSLRQYRARAALMMGKMGSQPEAGLKLEGWAREAGLRNIRASRSPMRNPGHLVRVTGEAAEQAVAYGMATRGEVDAWREGWEEWERTDGHEFVFQCGEVLSWKE